MILSVCVSLCVVMVPVWIGDNLWIYCLLCLSPAMCPGNACSTQHTPVTHTHTHTVQHTDNTRITLMLHVKGHVSVKKFFPANSSE